MVTSSRVDKKPEVSLLPYREEVALRITSILRSVFGLERCGSAMLSLFSTWFALNSAEVCMALQAC